jgi:hypothetical protein
MFVGCALSIPLIFNNFLSLFFLYLYFQQEQIDLIWITKDVSWFEIIEIICVVFILADQQRKSPLIIVECFISNRSVNTSSTCGGNHADSFIKPQKMYLLQSCTLWAPVSSNLKDIEYRITTLVKMSNESCNVTSVSCQMSNLQI